jgi:diguanylate cyclase (GGDEF)-like protein
MVPADERRLMGPVSGLLWLAGGATAAAGRLLPGSPHEHAALFWGLVALTLAYAAACITGAIPWERVSLGGHAVAVTLLQPLVAASLWLTGGQDAFMGPVLVLPMLYVAYFFPPRYAWPLAALEIATYASPLLYAGGGHLLLQRALGYAVAYAGLTLTIQFLKRRLVEAERHQRRMAHQDPLTGLANRRAFDAALTAAFQSPEARFALLLIDVDAFKQINDRFGHSTGDRVLRELAAHASAEVRAADCLARIGGDELALVAPGAGRDAALRLSGALAEAAARVTPGHGAEPVSITVSHALFPQDGTDRATLLRALDRELHEGKTARRASASAP